MNKLEWRKKLKALRNDLSPSEIGERSSVIMEKVWSLLRVNNVKTIHTYLPIGSEVRTELLIEKAIHHQCKIIVPKTLSNRKLKHLIFSSFDDLVEGKYGTKYPENEKEFEGEFDAIIVPALGFDEKKYRLGYGSGYYDVFLNQYSRALKIGVGFDFQKVDSIPIEPHDVALDEVVLDRSL